MQPVRINTDEDALNDNNLNSNPNDGGNPNDFSQSRF